MRQRQAAGPQLASRVPRQSTVTWPQRLRKLRALASHGLSDECQAWARDIARIKVQPADSKIGVDAVADLRLRRGKRRPSTALVAATIFCFIRRIGRIVGLDHGRILRAVAALLSEPRQCLGVLRPFSEQDLVARSILDTGNRRGGSGGRDELADTGEFEGV